MSRIGARFSNNKAYVKPFLGVDPRTHQRLYGDEYEIKCTWTHKSETMLDEDGNQFISRTQVWNQDPRPKRFDLIRLNGHSNYIEIKHVTEWDMMCLRMKEPEYRIDT